MTTSYLCQAQRMTKEQDHLRRSEHNGAKIVYQSWRAATDHESSDTHLLSRDQSQQAFY